VEGAGTWCLRIDDGRSELDESSSPADLEVACDEPAFIGILAGEIRLFTAYLRGDVALLGELSLALRFRGLGSPAAPADAVPGMDAAE
jgi:hypothetical protein